jgi:hypothetical protein
MFTISSFVEAMMPQHRMWADPLPAMLEIPTFLSERLTASP